MNDLDGGLEVEIGKIANDFKVHKDRVYKSVKETNVNVSRHEQMVRVLHKRFRALEERVRKLEERGGGDV